MNNRFLVIATLSGGSWDDNEVWSNQWNVGTFEQLGTCYMESELDLKQTLKDSFEYRFEGEENEQELLEQHVNSIFSEREKCHRLENELKLFEPTILLSIQYEPHNDYCRVEINYLVIRIKD
jgi:hypothetical protein